MTTANCKYTVQLIGSRLNLERDDGPFSPQLTLNLQICHRVLSFDDSTVFLQVYCWTCNHLTGNWSYFSLKHRIIIWHRNTSNCSSFGLFEMHPAAQRCILGCLYAFKDSICISNKSGQNDKPRTRIQFVACVSIFLVIVELLKYSPNRILNLIGRLFAAI